MTRTTPVSTAPNALIASRRRQPDSVAAASGGPCPPWLSVKHTNTPTRVQRDEQGREPPKATSSATATPASRTIPHEYASRSPRNENWRGM